MTAFEALFREGQRIDRLDNGRLARSKASELLSGVGITFKTDLSPILVDNGAAVGIAFYSVLDLELLDRLVCSRARTVERPDSLIVFDVLNCMTMEDFERLIPGVGPVYQTPVVGIWRKGTLVDKATGRKGRTLLSERQYVAA